jgi:hypothetical protein
VILVSSEDIAAYLADHHNLQECILEEVRWRHFGTVLALVFDYIWTADGSVRPEYSSKDLICLSLRNVQEYHLFNGMSEYMSLHPEELNWGLSEVSSVRLVHEEFTLARYRSLPIPLHHLRCEWEGPRQIDVVFSTVEITKVSIDSD